MIMSDMIQLRIHDARIAGHEPDRLAITRGIYDVLLNEQMAEGQQWPSDLMPAVQRVFGLPLTVHDRVAEEYLDPLSQTREVFSVQSGNWRLDTTVSDEFLALQGGWRVRFGDRIFTKPDKSIHVRWGKNQ